VAGIVEAVAVDLHRQPMLGPAAVHPLGAGGAVGDRERKLGLLEPLEERLLELGERDVDVAVEDCSEVGGAGMLARDRLDVGGRRPVSHPGLVRGPSQVIEGEVGGEVDEGLRDGGDRDAAPERGHHLRAPDPETHHPPLGWRRDLGRRRRAPDEPKQMPRSTPAQSRSLAARSHRREKSRVHARRPVADAVDAPMLWQEHARMQPPLDLGERDPGLKQLRPRHDAVRAARNSADREIRGRFGSHYDP
jgi:hypothetical protein